MTTTTETPMTAGQKAAATRRANLAALADAGAREIVFVGSGMTFEMGKTCISCHQPQIAFPEDQLPGTSAKYPQCAACLDHDRRAIARVEAARAASNSRK